MKPHGNKKYRPANRLPTFRQMDADDTLLGKIIANIEFTEQDQALFDQISQAWTLLSSNPEPVARKLLKKLFGFTNEQNRALVEKAKNFFGDVTKVNVDAERRRQITMLESIIYGEHTKNVVKLDAIKTLAKITGTDRHDAGDKPPRKMAMVIYTQNPEALQDDETEAIEIDE